MVQIPLILRDQGRKLVLKFKSKSGTSLNVLKLAGGTAGGQILAVAFSPILTRLYGPEKFGTLATFISIATLISVVSSLRYELAIAIPEEDDEAVSIVRLCVVLVLSSTALLLILYLFPRSITFAFLANKEPIQLFWVLPFGVFFTGLCNISNYWAIRRKKFGLLAKSKFYQAICSTATALLTFSFSDFGLLFAHVIGQAATFFVVFKSESKEFFSLKKLKVKYLKIAFERYSGFGIYGLPAGIVSAAGSQLPVILFSMYFSSDDVGQLIVSQRLFSLPAGLMTASVSQVFFANAVDASRSGNLRSYIIKSGLKVLPFALIISVFIGYFLAPFTPMLVGTNWNLVRDILPLLIPMVLGEACVSTFSTAFAASQNNRLCLVANIFNTSLRLGSFFLAVLVNSSFLSAVFIFSAGCFTGYLVYAFILLFALRSRGEPNALSV